MNWGMPKLEKGKFCIFCNDIAIIQFFFSPPIYTIQFSFPLHHIFTQGIKIYVTLHLKFFFFHIPILLGDMYFYYFFMLDVNFELLTNQLLYCTFLLYLICLQNLKKIINHYLYNQSNI